MDHPVCCSKATNRPCWPILFEAAFEAAEQGQAETAAHVDKGRPDRGTCAGEPVDWLDGDRRFPGELRIASRDRQGRSKDPIGCLRVRCVLMTSHPDRSPSNSDSRHPRPRGIEHAHRTLDVTFQEDLSRVRKGHGVQNMALSRRKFADQLRAVCCPPLPPTCRSTASRPRACSQKASSCAKIVQLVESLAEILTANPVKGKLTVFGALALSAGAWNSAPKLVIGALARFHRPHPEAPARCPRRA